MRGVKATVAISALVLASCGNGGSASSPSTQPHAAGATPSVSARMICSDREIREISRTLGEPTVRRQGPTWSNHVYSCSYVYPTGTIRMSVKELSSWPETISYYESLGKQMGVAENIPAFGQGAFRTTNGSIVVRKDWKVLTIDVADLPPTFGVPPTPSSDVSYTVADVILGCWSGR